MNTRYLAASPANKKEGKYMKRSNPTGTFL